MFMLVSRLLPACSSFACFLLAFLVCFLLAFLVCFLLVFPVCFLLAFLGLCRQPHCGCEPFSRLIYIKYPSFLKNNRGNIWRVLKKSIPLHSLFGNTPVSNKRKEFFEKIYINREVVQEASAGFSRPLLCSGKQVRHLGRETNRSILISYFQLQ